MANNVFQSHLAFTHLRWSQLAVVYVSSCFRELLQLPMVKVYWVFREMRLFAFIPLVNEYLPIFYHLTLPSMNTYRYK